VQTERQPLLLLPWSCFTVTAAPAGTQVTMSSAHFNRGPAYGLSAEVKNKVRLGRLPGQKSHSWGSLNPLFGCLM
jgi:hypothetical protein